MIEKAHRNMNPLVGMLHQYKFTQNWAIGENGKANENLCNSIPHEIVDDQVHSMEICYSYIYMNIGIIYKYWNSLLTRGCV